MAQDMSHAFWMKQFEVKPHARALFPRQSASANSTVPDASTIETCATNCMVAAFTVVPECNYDMPCMCAKDTFRTSVKACMKSTCNFSGAGYDAILDEVFDQCVNCDYGGLSCTNGTSASGSAGGNDSLDITIPSSLGSASASGSKPSSSTSAGGGGDDKSSGTPVAAIAGGIVGGVIVIALVGVLIWWMARKNKRNNGNVALPTTPTGEVKFNHPPSQPQHQPGLAYNQPQQPAPVPVPYGADFAPSTLHQQQQQQHQMYTTAQQHQPNADLGYVPPSQFMQYAPPPPGAYPAGMSASNVSTGSSAPMLSTHASYRPPSSDASSSSGGAAFNPYTQQPQPRPLTLHTDTEHGGAAWPRDEKRPLNVMSADEPRDGLPAYQR
ncbi:hypothetical protein BKA62DRAFT_775504 [Auriculariales sp. MPI-PUGE-AT-0066]|nr:hypothetical protein BKA62DRAFT_775504 [Auriculariales sp. MPI-PUGE-AT-0066]